MKLVVVNADDLGYDPEIDRGILEAHARGLVTSATAMVETPFSREALRRAPASLGIGLHAVIDASSGRAGAEESLRRQLDRFAELRGAPPTHLDSHKHAHASPGVLEAFAAVALAAGLPVRSVDARMRALLRSRGVATPDHFLGDAERRPAWTEAALVTALSTLAEGITEVMTHPGHRPRMARTSFGAEREVELAALCGEAARRALAASGARACDFPRAFAERAREGGSAGRDIDRRGR